MIRISRKAIKQLNKFHGLTEEEVIKDVLEMEGVPKNAKYEIVEDDNVTT